MEPLDDVELGGSRRRSRPERPVRGARTGSSAGMRKLVLLAVLAGVLAFVALQPEVAGPLSRLVDGVRGAIGPARPAPSKGAAQPSPEDRLEAIEITLHPMALRLDLVENRLMQMEGQIRQIAAERGVSSEAAGGPQMTKLADNVAKLREDLDAMRRLGSDAAAAGRLSSAIEKTEVAVRRLSGRRENPALFLLAIGHLREAADRGGPFEAQLRAATQLGGARVATALPVLEHFAGAGVPTRAALLERLRQDSSMALRAAADESGNWLLGRAWQAINTVISIRQVAGMERGVAAALAHAERLMAAGDLRGSLAQMRTVTGAALDVLAPWIEAASARAAVDAVISEMAAAALAQAATADE